METFKPKIEQDPSPKDISHEFLSMRVSEFLDFLRTLRKEPSLSITIDWAGAWQARRLKGFLEEYDAIKNKQKRSAAIRTTQEQHDEEMNVFASGVKWIKAEK